MNIEHNQGTQWRGISSYVEGHHLNILENNLRIVPDQFYLYPQYTVQSILMYLFVSNTVYINSCAHMNFIAYRQKCIDKIYNVMKQNERMRIRS